MQVKTKWIIIGPKQSDLDVIIKLLKVRVLVNCNEMHWAFKITDKGTLDKYLDVKVDHLPSRTIKLSQCSMTWGSTSEPR
jgi:hypothetical protein